MAEYCRPQNDPLLTPKEVQKILNVGRAHSYNLIKKEIPHVKLGRCVRVRESVLAKYIRDREGLWS